MTKFPAFRFLILLLAGWLVTDASWADEDETGIIPEWLVDRQIHYRSDRGLPLNALLSPGEIESYRKALSGDACDPAYELLANAYANAYPEEPHPASGFEARTNWEIYVVPNQYPELALCLELRHLGELRAQLARDGIRMDPLSWEDLGAPQVNDTVRSITISVWQLFFLVRNRYLPAAMAMLRLSEEGEIIRFTREFQYYMTLRTRILGTDTAELREMTDRATARLDAGTIVELRQQATNGEFTYSDDWLE